MAPTKPTKALMRDETAGSVGFAGAESGTEPNSQEGERAPGADRAELPEQYAHAHARAEPSAASVQPRPEGEAFAQRVHWFTGRGLSIESAEALADRLASRDADYDDRRLCLECSYLGTQGRCIAAATGRVPGASARLEPVQTILQRCEAFGLRKGLV